MALGIVNLNTKKEYPKVIKQSEPVNDGMYKAVFNRFVTLGFQDDDFNEGKVKFEVVFGFELLEDMAGNKIPPHVKEFDDGSTETGAKTIFRQYPLADDLHHKSNGFAIAKSLNPNIPTIRRGRDKEHEYIVDFEWEPMLGKSVLLQIAKRTSKAGNNYNQIKAVMPLGLDLKAEGKNVFFNLYDPAYKGVWDADVYGWEKKKIRESNVITGEPLVIYREEVKHEETKQEQPKYNEPKQEQPKYNEPVMDFDDDIPF